jgi:hypothetical protein
MEPNRIGEEATAKTAAQDDREDGDREWKREARTIAQAAVERLGADSPASILACDPMLLRHFVTSYVVRDPLAERMAAVQDSDPVMLGKVLHAISEEVREQAIAARFTRRGGVEVVVDAMHRHATSSRVVKNACRTLWNLSSHSELTGHGGEIEATVVAALQRFKDDAKVQTQAIGALANLLVSDDAAGRTMVMAKGGLEAIIAALRASPTSLELLHSGCLALSNLACE